ncbi:MAG: sulfite exporter TauE/SafE family protein [Ruminococcaceae bacterium]|nr:sulfite exporter TauE/SafE family protein [Oscillospiraceae bacterium]
MELFQAVLLILVGFGAGFVQRVSGFGLGIFAMMFLPHFLPSHTAAATISTLFSCVTSTYNAAKYRKSVDYKTALPMLCAALVSIPVAVYCSVKVSGEVFELLLGVVLILLSLWFLFFSKDLRINATAFGGALAGAVGGALNGLFSTGGPPVVLYLSSAMQSNLAYFATIQFYFGVTNLYSVATRAVNGIVTGEILLCAAVGVVGCMLGDVLGKAVFDRLNAQKLKYVIYAGMILSGILMII